MVAANSLVLGLLGGLVVFVQGSVVFHSSTQCSDVRCQMVQSRYILGISAYYHDSAAALIRNGEIIGAAQEERFTRVKYDPAFPANSIRYVLEKEK